MQQRDAKGTNSVGIPGWAVEAVADWPAIPAADAGPLIAIFAAARARCEVATAKHRADELVRTPVDHRALARRREAALRLPPLADGRRDPMDPAA